MREELVCGKQARSRLSKRRAPTEWGGYNPIRVHLLAFAGRSNGRGLPLLQGVDAEFFG
jgi:hypothetical protein